MNNGKTRLKLTLLMIMVSFIEGLIKSFAVGFPLTEVFSIQAVIFGGYMAVKTVSNINESKYEPTGEST